MLLLGEFHRQRPRSCFYLEGGDKSSITAAVTQMFACLFSLLGVAASSYEKYGKNSETRGISAYLFPSVILPAIRPERRRVGACRWHRLHKRERALLERRAVRGVNDEQRRVSAWRGGPARLAAPRHVAASLAARHAAVVPPPRAAVSPSSPRAPAGYFGAGRRGAGGPRGALAGTERGPG